MANFFFMMGDFLLSNHAIDRRHIYYALALPTCYAIFEMCFTLANDKYGHQPVYFFLDASNPVQPAWIFGVLLIHLVLFCVIWLFSSYVLKRQLLYGPNANKELKSIDTKSLIVADAENPAFQDS